MISHRYRFVFVEIPHTASHSISEQLAKYYEAKPILRKHANVTQFLGQASGDEKRYFKFATVRNPLDALTTDYLKVVGNHRGQYTNPQMLIENGGHITKQHLREYRFVHDNSADFPSFFKKFRARLYNNWFLIGDQHFDCVIRFEDLQAGVSEVLRRIGVPQQEPVAHVNPTRGKSKQFVDYYTPDIYAQVAWYYGPFMKKWGYAFPEKWGHIEVPKLAEMQFRLLDRSAKVASRFFTLDPNNPTLHRCKQFVDFATGWR
jgi:hypothetical protein